jgi:hypothetical protein
VVVSRRGNAGMLFQADSGFYFRLAGGYVNMSLSQDDPEQVTALTNPTSGAVRRFQDYLRQARVGAVLIEQAWAQPWMSVFARIGMRGTSAGGVTVYDAGRPRPAAPGQRRPGPRPHRVPQMRPDASAAPSASAASFAQPSSGWIRDPNPQSAPAITFSAPSRSV